MKKLLVPALLLVLLTAPFASAQNTTPGEILATSYPSIQEALDANPGKMICLPPGNHEISKAIEIKSDHSGLYGMGTIVQTNPGEFIIRIEGRKGVRLSNITLTRPEGKMETDFYAICANNCDELTVDGVQVFNNLCTAHTIYFNRCRRSNITNCLIENYMSFGVGDRTSLADDYGFAFKFLSGNGISTRGCEGQLIQGNRIIETQYIPTREMKEKYRLGDFVKMNEKKGRLVPQSMWDAKYKNDWHQGSAITCRFPAVPDGQPEDTTASQYTRIIGNYIQNAAQGIDIHGDHVIVANNIVNDSFMGMKSMHGSRDVIITGNQFSKSALWGIYIGPGNFAHPATAATDKQPAMEANVQAATIIANNIISDFGYGHSYWIWKDYDLAPLCGIAIDKGQRPEITPAKDILIEGNIVYDPGVDGTIGPDGKVVLPPPRYHYALWVETQGNAPQNVVVGQNLFSPGSKGISNIDLKTP